MSFAHPQLLWLLALPAALLAAAAFARARATGTTLPKIHRALLRPSGLRLQSSGPLSARPLAALLGLACLILALARPQGAVISTPSFTQARDVLVAVDVSRSMLADDVAPTRLDRARLLVRSLADALRGERLGLLPFAGTAFLQSPLSADYEIFRTFLDELGPDMIPAGGSDFAALLRVAGDAFGPAPSAADDTPPPDRYLVVLSDGEAENEAWRPLAQRLAERGVRVIALGLGTSAGAMVPDGKGGLTKDSRGAAVLSRLNPATLQDLARATDGAYRDASSWVDLPVLLKETIARGRASRVGTESAPRRQEFFAWFLAPALLLIVFSLAREFPPVPRVSAKPLLPSPATIARLIPFALCLHGALILTPRAFAIEPAPAPDPLLALVEKLSTAPELPPEELARLATLSAERGEQARAKADKGAPFPEGAVRDALAAVSVGQNSDPKAADWAALRKRLEALLAPPPQQQQPQPQNQKPQDSPQKPDKDQKSSDQSPSSSPDKSPSEQSQPKPDDSQSGSKEGSTGAPQDSSSKPSPDSSPKPPGEKPLGDLASPDKPGKDSDAPDKGAAPADQPPPESADEPTQQAGGVSASGRPADGEPTGDMPALDPALAVPQQRLEHVRDSDSPARLFQLLQDSETPPEERERRAAGAKQTW